MLCSLLALAGPASGRLIVNGGFETPGVPAAGLQTYSTGASFGGWTVVGTAGNVGRVSDTYSLGGLSFPARSGDRFLDLTGLSNTATGVEQVVRTSAGTVYDLSFWVGNMVIPGGWFG